MDTKTKQEYLCIAYTTGNYHDESHVHITRCRNYDYAAELRLVGMNKGLYAKCYIVSCSEDDLQLHPRCIGTGILTGDNARLGEIDKSRK